MAKHVGENVCDAAREPGGQAEKLFADISRRAKNIKCQSGDNRKHMTEYEKALERAEIGVGRAVALGLIAMAVLIGLLFVVH